MNSQVLQKLQEAKKILFKYWAFASFRPTQEKIITSVLEANDTLGLLPTGGGKSITFQVPAMVNNGLCLVITPLIALMKDQVEKLQQLGMKAVCIHSGLTSREIDIALNNVLFGDYKFLYVSPERLDTDIFKSRLQRMNINLIAVDEAHCISQWGYDFRPAYLKIAQIRKLIPETPVLALTATATSHVIEDIQEKLQFKQKNVVSTSFERKNLAYMVRYEENKLRYILNILPNTKSSGIIYVRNRKNTKEISRFLQDNGISSDYYHAGLSHAVRSQKQEDWIKGKTKIIVSTNAFGMGIDKPDVRFVIHHDIPDSIEEYFQEAGRAGRDGKKAYAVMLYNNSDEVKFKQRLTNSFPEISNIKRIYNALGNYFQLPVGAGKGMTYDFNLADFATVFRFSLLHVYSALGFLQKEGYLEFSEELNNPSKIIFQISRDDIYKFQVEHKQYDGFIKLLLRSYTGVFTNYVSIDEQLLARRGNIKIDDVFRYLQALRKIKLIDYIPCRKNPTILYSEQRLDDKSLLISSSNYNERKKRYIEKQNAIINYATSISECRSKMLLEYFNQPGASDCGICDVCKARNEKDITKDEQFTISERILKELENEELSLPKLMSKLVDLKSDDIINIIRWLIDQGEITYTVTGKIQKLK